MKRIATTFLALIGFAVASSAQESVDLNEYYRYPVSIGAQFRQLTPSTDFTSTFIVREFSGLVRRPFGSAPLFFYGATGGVLQYDSQDQLLPEKWDHSHFFLAPMFGVSQRLAKEFEFGAGVIAGISQSVFPSAIDVPVGSVNLVAGADAKLSLNPSFNVSIDIAPALRYIYPFSEYRDYGGFSFGIGMAAHYRFGRDPDSAGTLIRAIRFGEIEIPDAFAAMQSFYVEHPIGTVAITNTERQTLTDVTISFFQSGFMDSPTTSARIAELPAGETRDVNLHASFNDEVFSREGITPLNGEVIVTYSLQGRPAEQRETVTYDLHDKTALTWSDDRKVGAFITPADSALRNYATFIGRAGNEERAAGLSDALETAMLAYAALDEIGILYQVDPTSPFTQVQENAVLVDSISLPRDTLTRIAGDCDDLTVLYASLLESVGVETGFITVPGHIYAAINTGVRSRDYGSVHPDRDMTIELDGSLWVPVEITLVGREPFMAAWSSGVDLWHRYDNDVSKRGFYRTAEAQRVFRPVGLREEDLGLQYGDPEAIAASFARDRDRLSAEILAVLSATAGEDNTVPAWNAYGIAAAGLMQYNAAVTAFRTAAQIDRDALSPRVNLGAVSFLRQDFRSALSAFQEAETILSSRGRTSTSNAMATVLLNISKSYHALERYAPAREYFERAAGIAPEQAESFSYLAEIGGSGGNRAANAADVPAILFIEEEE